MTPEDQARFETDLRLSLFRRVFPAYFEKLVAVVNQDLLNSQLPNSIPFTIKAENYQISTNLTSAIEVLPDRVLIPLDGMVWNSQHPKQRDFDPLPQAPHDPTNYSIGLTISSEILQYFVRSLYAQTFSFKYSIAQASFAIMDEVPKINFKSDSIAFHDIKTHFAAKFVDHFSLEHDILLSGSYRVIFQPKESNPYKLELINLSAKIVKQSNFLLMSYFDFFVEKVIEFLLSSYLRHLPLQFIKLPEYLVPVVSQLKTNQLFLGLNLVTK